MPLHGRIPKRAFCWAIFALWLLPLAGCCKPFLTKSTVITESAPTVRKDPLCEMPLCQYGTDDGTKIVVVDIDGLLLNSDFLGLYSQGENPVSVFREKLDRIASDGCVRAIVLRINTYGGGVTASDMMWHDLAEFKARTRLPVVACMMDVAAGGGYLLATGADQIVAHPTTVTGGIGVMLNLYNLQDAMAQFNVVGIPVKSGENIDIGSPVVALTPDSRALLQNMSDEFHNRFKTIVRESRPLRPDQLDELDGRVFTAQQALDRNLVDQIGYLDDAIGLARSLGTCAGARIVLLHRPKDRVRTAYDITPNIPLQTTLLPISIPGLERTRLPTFMYLWQPEPTLDRLSGK
jgi:protease-4